MKTANTSNEPEWHNPENLTPEQVGKEFRLFTKEEVEGDVVLNDSCELHGQKDVWCPCHCGCALSVTYRVPKDTPIKKKS